VRGRRGERGRDGAAARMRRRSDTGQAHHTQRTHDAEALGDTRSRPARRPAGCGGGCFLGLACGHIEIDREASKGVSVQVYTSAAVVTMSHRRSRWVFSGCSTHVLQPLPAAICSDPMECEMTSTSCRAASTCLRSSQVFLLTLAFRARLVCEYPWFSLGLNRTAGGALAW
jgi:hypothetical protein